MNAYPLGAAHSLIAVSRASRESISSAQMAHSLEPVTRQRDDKAQLAHRSRFLEPDIRKAEISLCVRQFETASS
ncbi:Acyl-coenzyme A oxidase 3 [Fusarium oxysporum f. sp. albedinis]|nr:Acyl-coenzyme A oxidase 3 [Fusarium oxysporum f. sp. albedinis]